jgi:hypothetical protein
VLAAGGWVGLCAQARVEAETNVKRNVRREEETDNKARRLIFFIPTSLKNRWIDLSVGLSWLIVEYVVSMFHDQILTDMHSPKYC